MTLEETRGTHVNAINIKSGKRPAEAGKRPAEAGKRPAEAGKHPAEDGSKFKPLHEN